MLLSTIPKKYVYALLAGIALTILLFGHYSYPTLADSNALQQPPSPPPPAPSNTQVSKPEPEPELEPPSKPLSAQPFPSKIWQSWKDDAEDPTGRTVGFPHQWRAVNPEWRYERITDANNDAYVRARFDPTIWKVFISLRDPILKADFLRYLILLEEGGVWADIDVYPHQPISQWIPEQYQDSVNLVIGIENDHHKEPIWPGSPYSVQLCQYTVLAKPGHPAIKTLVDQVTRDLQHLIESKQPGDGITFEEVMTTTGPFAFTKVMMDYFKNMTDVEHTGNELDNLEEPRLIGDVLVLPKDSFGWLPQDQTHEKGDEIILVEHLFIGSWRDGHPG